MAKINDALSSFELFIKYECIAKKISFIKKSTTDDSYFSATDAKFYYFYEINNPEKNLKGLVTAYAHFLKFQTDPKIEIMFNHIHKIFLQWKLNQITLNNVQKESVIKFYANTDLQIKREAISIITNFDIPLAPEQFLDEAQQEYFKLIELI